jgi:hypothetical protein
MLSGQQYRLNAVSYLSMSLRLFLPLRISLKVDALSIRSTKAIGIGSLVYNAMQTCLTLEFRQLQNLRRKFHKSLQPARVG